MRAHDRLGTAEAAQRLRAQHARACLALGLPDPLHHELQVGRLDPARAVELHLPQHAVDERRTRCPSLVARRQARSSGSSGPTMAARAAETVEMVEPQPVREHVRDPAPGRRRAARARPRAARAGRGRAAARGASAAGRATARRVVVEEVLLELVEDEERAPRRRASGSVAVGGPRRRARDLGVRRRLAQPPRDRGARGSSSCRRRSARRAPSASTRAGSRRSPRVSRSRPKKSSASSSRVVERRETLVRADDARRDRVHAAASVGSPSCRPSAVDVFVERQLEQVDVARAPELAARAASPPAAPPRSGRRARSSPTSGRGRGGGSSRACRSRGRGSGCAAASPRAPTGIDAGDVAGAR